MTTTPAMSAATPAPDPGLTAHRVRTNSRISLHPIGYDSNGAAIYPWQLEDSDA